MAIVRHNFSEHAIDLSTNPQTVTLSFTPTVGRQLVVVLCGGRSDRSMTATSGPVACTMLHRTTSDVGGAEPPAFIHIAAGTIDSATTSLTITCDAAGAAMSSSRVIAYEYTGLLTPYALTGTPTSVSGTGTSATVGTVTPTTDPALFLWSVKLGGSSGGFSGLDADFTEVTTATTGEYAERIQAGSTTAHICTVSWVNSQTYHAQLAALAGASSSRSFILVRPV